MIGWVLGRRKRRKGRPKRQRKRPSYEAAKAILTEGDVAARRELASHEDIEPEILYYLASDEAPEVRRAVAENEGTPLQADVILAEDPDDRVRIELAHKIGRLVPDISADERDRLSKMTIQVLEILARDQLAEVRAIVAEEIKRATNIPRRLVRRLAEDAELAVSAPVLEYSPLLGDTDLLEIISRGLEGGALAAISRRRNLSESVADAVVATNNIEAVAALLGNKSARISDRTIDMIAVEAEGVTQWHAPLVDRGNLPIRTVRRIASFVSASLFEQLVERSNLPPEVADELRAKVRKRIDEGALGEEHRSRIEAMERAERLHREGRLDERVLIEAIDANDHDFVRQALALMAGLPSEVVARMLRAGSAKAVTALAWKAGLSMRTAVKLQRTVAGIQPRAILRAREGTRYPLSRSDLEWQLEFFAG